MHKLREARPDLLLLSQSDQGRPGLQDVYLSKLQEELQPVDAESLLHHGPVNG